MRELTEKEVKLKQQLVDSPAHPKVPCLDESLETLVGFYSSLSAGELLSH